VSKRLELIVLLAEDEGAVACRNASDWWICMRPEGLSVLLDWFRGNPRKAMYRLRMTERQQSSIVS